MISSLPYTLMFSTTLILGTIISISSNSWLMMWMGLELNLLSFIPLMMTPSMNQETEATMKYFLTQACASTIIIFSMSFYSFPKESIIPNNLIISMLILSLLMKLGMTPCHWWFPTVMSKLSWPMSLILISWQKIAPMLILMTISSNTPNFIILCSILMGALVGGTGGMNQTNLRPLLAYSSIGHMSWILAANMISYSISTLYFTSYLLITSSLMLFLIINLTHSHKNLFSWKHMHLSTTIPMCLLLMSMAGIPPFLGFMPKMLTFHLLMQTSLFPIAMFLLMGSTMNLSYYMNIMFNLFSPPHTTKKTQMTNTLNIFLTVLATCPMLLLSTLSM